MILHWFKVCDKRGDPCDSLCGGAGCGMCGGLSCENGAVTKAGNALKIAKEAEGFIRGKETDAEELLRGVSTTFFDMSPHIYINCSSTQCCH